MKKLYWNIIINLFFLFFDCYPQNFYFKHKKIGILISKKNLSIDSYQAKFWASYLQINDSLGLTEESLKTAVTIKLGQLLQNWFKEFLDASEVYFLNEGKKFENIIKNYPFHEKPHLPISLDYIFCIDTLQFYSIKEKTVFTVSNKLFTEYQTKMLLKGQISIYQIENFELIKQQSLQIDENQAYTNPILIEKLAFKIEKLVASWLNHFFL